MAVTDNSARWSRYLIFFILAVLPLERIPALDITHPISATIRLSQVAGVVLILLNLPLLWQRRRDLIKGPWLWLLAFLGAITISAAFAVDHQRSLVVLAYTIFVAVLAWVVSLRFEREEIRHYIGILVTSALVACAIGYYQFFGDLFGLSTKLTGLRPQYTEGVFGFPRIQSTALEPLYFGDYLLIPSAILTTLIAISWKWRWKAPALLVILTVVWLTVSRAAIVALIVILLIGLGLALFRRQLKGAVTIVAVSALSILLAIGLISYGTGHVHHKTAQTSHAVSNFSKQATNLSDGQSAESRAVTRHLAIDAFKANPVFGVGPGNFGSYAMTQDASMFDTTSIVNNEPLELLAETGLVGSILFAAFLGSLAWLAVKRLRRYRHALDWALGFALGLALIGIAIQYQTFSTLYITHVWVVIGLLMGVITALPLKKA